MKAVVSFVTPPKLLAYFCFIVLLLAPQGIVVAQDQDDRQSVNNLRLWHSPENTRVVFDVSADVRYSSFSLQNPLRLVVDIENADQSFNLPVLSADNTHIAAVRSGRPQPELLRFVFELKKPLKTSSFLLSPNEIYGHRLVIDMDDEAVADQRPVVSGTGSPSSESLPVVTAGRKRQDAPLIVAIDAGHGGEDPGAIGYRGSREKKITLSIAERLKKIVDQDPHMRSYMVRKGDYFVKLDKRRQMARAVNADVFVSIHADAFGRRSARGFSVFALSQRGATSAMARALAAKENASDLIGGVSLADKDEVLAKVLVDLSMTNTISDSVNLGGRVLQELGSLGKLHSKRVEQAGFAVLKSPDIASILIETGFITNPDEERNLRSAKYQQKLATAIYTAISEYRQRTPYSNTATYASPAVSDFSSQAVAKTKAKPRPEYHKVVRGDSLSTIAARYDISVQQLKRINRLKSSVAVLGKRLKLPGSSDAVAASSPRTRRVTSGKSATHTVQRGDSLSKISARYNVTINAIKRQNKLKRNTVYLGQQLKIPGVAERSKRDPRYHRVRRGDTLSEIAQRYGATMKTIMSANKLPTRTVMLGQNLKIPYE